MAGQIDGTAANVNDVTQAHALVHGKEADVFGDAGYQGVDKREETQKLRMRWHVARRAAFEPGAAPLAPHRLYVDGSVRQNEF